MLYLYESEWWVVGVAAVVGLVGEQVMEPQAEQPLLDP
jgi:hypothetical protein